MVRGDGSYGNPTNEPGYWNPTAQRPPDPTQTPTYVLEVPRDKIGYVIGRGGENIKRIREASKCTVMVDTQVKCSLIRIYGAAENSRLAKDMILAKTGELAAEGGGEDGGEKPQAQIKIDMRHIGFVIGRGGATIKKIREDSGAFITAEEQKAKGFTMLKIMGEPEAVKKAQELIEGKVAEMAGREGGGPGTIPTACEIQVVQEYIANLIGKAGECLNALKEQSGASITIDQTTKDQGYSVVKVFPGPNAEFAQALLISKLQEIEWWKIYGEDGSPCKGEFKGKGKGKLQTKGLDKLGDKRIDGPPQLALPPPPPPPVPSVVVPPGGAAITQWNPDTNTAGGKGNAHQSKSSSPTPLAPPALLALPAPPAFSALGEPPDGELKSLLQEAMDMGSGGGQGNADDLPADDFTSQWLNALEDWEDDTWGGSGDVDAADKSKDLLSNLLRSGNAPPLPPAPPPPLPGAPLQCTPVPAPDAGLPVLLPDLPGMPPLPPPLPGTYDFNAGATWGSSSSSLGPLGPLGSLLDASSGAALGFPGATAAWPPLGNAPLPHSMGPAGGDWAGATGSQNWCKSSTWDSGTAWTNGGDSGKGNAWGNSGTWGKGGDWDGPAGGPDWGNAGGNGGGKGGDMGKAMVPTLGPRIVPPGGPPGAAAPSTGPSAGLQLLRQMAKTNGPAWS